MAKLMGRISQSLHDEKLQLNGSQGERKFEFIMIYIDVCYVNVTEKNNTILFVCFDSLRPSQQSFSYVGTDLPGFNQY